MSLSSVFGKEGHTKFYHIVGCDIGILGLGMEKCWNFVSMVNKGLGMDENPRLYWWGQNKLKLRRWGQQYYHGSWKGKIREKPVGPFTRSDACDPVPWTAVQRFLSRWDAWGFWKNGWIMSWAKAMGRIHGKVFAHTESQWIHAKFFDCIFETERCAIDKGVHESKRGVSLC